jgi:DNA-directed RNA polymerase specialized sigma24 family protein
MINSTHEDPERINSNLLIQAQSYLSHRQSGMVPSQSLEAAWTTFYDQRSRTVHRFAYTCGASEDQIGDCLQEVWTELLVRLPSFTLDPHRGTIETWLFRIVQSKVANLRRLQKHHLLQENCGVLLAASDSRTAHDRDFGEEVT